MWNLKYLRLMLFACSSSFFLFAQAESTDTLNLVVGAQQVYVHAAPVKRVAIGSPDIVGMTMLTSHNILLTGKQAGTTEIAIWESEKAALPAKRIKVAVSVSTALEKQRLQFSKTIKLLPAGNQVAIAGEVESLEEHALARQAIDKSATVPMDATVSSFDNQVQIDIKVVEVSRKNMMRAGFFLGKNRGNATFALGSPGSLGGATFDDGGLNGGFSLNSSSGFLPNASAFNFLAGNASRGLLGALSILENNGFAYTLAEPSLTAISGQSASFLAGGEFPIPIQSGAGGLGAVTIRYKEYGVRLMLTPTVLDTNRIFLKVSPEVSEIDFSNAVQSGGVAVPGLRVRRTDTSVSLGDGESFVISGLVSRNTLQNVDKFPGLGNLPVIGAFFRSTRFDLEDKELLMIVTPHLIRPIARNAEMPALPGGNLHEYSPSFSDLFFQTGTKPDTGIPVTGFSR
ncbi:pilus assembly protein CpaC [Methylophilus rhizosphaerae]|uniref:Pilus assembly protein CpaC n=1 Tax=Methylophilus rhizosphaerae TaxID=492660 RepID=A0A1G9A4P4_9PROT|nr:type II and III secretion system protein family protein [Methylophilus rhizosphaerae]SDK21824.1 pilus assembly protein CpaC [Methylophilus rhizosphaerae]